MKPSNYPIPFPCFPNTDVPLACLFIHLEKGYSLDQFLQDFPSVSETQVHKLLGWTIDFFKNHDDPVQNK